MELDAEPATFAYTESLSGTCLRWEPRRESHGHSRHQSSARGIGLFPRLFFGPGLSALQWQVSLPEQYLPDGKRLQIKLQRTAGHAQFAQLPRPEHGGWLHLRPRARRRRRELGLWLWRGSAARLLPRGTRIREQRLRHPPPAHILSHLCHPRPEGLRADAGRLGDQLYRNPAEFSILGSN